MIDDDVVRDDDRDDHARREVSLRTERHNKNRLEGLGRGAAAAATRARALAPGGRRAVAGRGRLGRVRARENRVFYSSASSTGKFLF